MDTQTDGHLTSSVDITVGQPPSCPAPSHLTAHLTLGGPEASSARSSFQSLVTAELIDLHLPVLVLDCVSQVAAENLAQTINEVWKSATSGQDNFFSNLAASWKSEDTILANVLAKAEGPCVRISVALSPWLLQHYKTYVFLIFHEIGDLLAHQQTVDLDLDLACSVPDILNSPSPLLQLFSYVKLVLTVNTWEGLMDRIQELVDKYVGTPDLIGPACLLTLFSAGKLTLSFRSPAQLPRCLKDMMPDSVTVTAMVLAVKAKLALEERRVLEALAEAVQGPARLYWWTPYCALQVTAEVSGLSRLIRA